MAYQTVQGEALGRILMVLTNFTIGLSGKAREKPGKAGPIWRAPDASYQPEKIFTYKIFLVLQLLLVKFFKFDTIKMEKCQICWFDQLIKSQKEGSQEKTFLVKFTQNFTN